MFAAKSFDQIVAPLRKLADKLYAHKERLKAENFDKLAQIKVLELECVENLNEIGKCSLTAKKIEELLP
jgi:hypothetical protein